MTMSKRLNRLEQAMGFERADPNRVPDFHIRAALSRIIVSERGDEFRLVEPCDTDAATYLDIRMNLAAADGREREYARLLAKERRARGLTPASTQRRRRPVWPIPKLPPEKLKEIAATLNRMSAEIPNEIRRRDEAVAAAKRRLRRKAAHS